MQPITLLYTTCPDASAARTIATALLEERLAACCNILPPLESHYRWNGSLTESTEIAMLCKTTPDKAARAIACIEALHPYECPAILRLPAESTPAFAHWVAAETTANEKP